MKEINIVLGDVSWCNSRITAESEKITVHLQVLPPLPHLFSSPLLFLFSVHFANSLIVCGEHVEISRDHQELQRGERGAS